MSTTRTTVTVTCDTGNTWTTEFNGDHNAAVRYFLGQVFTFENVNDGTETKHRVNRVESNPIK
jgi:hypothetical protein